MLKANENLDRLLSSVRDMLNIRVKLGAFRNLDLNEIDNYLRQLIGLSKWQVYNDTAEILKLFSNVTSENIKSFYPLLWLLDADWHYCGKFNDRFDWITQYDKFVRRMRVRLLLAYTNFK